MKAISLQSLIESDPIDPMRRETDEPTNDYARYYGKPKTRTFQEYLKDLGAKNAVEAMEIVAKRNKLMRGK